MINTDILFAIQDPNELRAKAIQFIQDQARYIQDLEEALKRNRKARFGRKTEAFRGEERLLLEEDIDADGADIERQLKALLLNNPVLDVTPNKAKRHALPADLPRETIQLSLESTECPDCGGALRYMRDEVSERLDYIPARFIVRRTVRAQLNCPCCQKVVSAKLPSALIDKGQADVGLLAHVAVSKACDHLPLYRQQSIYQRDGVDIPRSTLADWFGAAGAALRPLVEALHQDLLTKPVLQADETPLLVFSPEKGKSQKGYLWAYTNAKVAKEANIILYDCQPGRGSQYPLAILQNWSGSLMVDDYAGYKPLFTEKGVIEAGCWAHARRKFFEIYQANQNPHVEYMVKAIRELYQLERIIEERPALQKQRWRWRYAKLFLKELHQWLVEREALTPPNSGLHKAIMYSLKRWKALTRYLEDGRIPMMIIALKMRYAPSL